MAGSAPPSPFVAGALSALALAPINLWPVLFLTFPVAVWLIDGSAAGRWSGPLAAAGVGWCFGFGYFLAGVYWVGYAFLVDAKTFGWLLPIAVAGLPAYLALFTALGFAAARLAWTRGPVRILTLAASLSAAEWLRGHVLTGFPWNAFGYALTEPLALAQTISLVGIWALTFLAVAIFATPALFADDRTDTPQPWRPLVAGFVVLAAMFGYGAARLATHPTEYVDKVTLRIMQPNLQQDVKFNYNAKNEVMARYLRLSNRATGPQSKGVHDATVLIWPESAFPFFLAREPDALAEITQLLQPDTTLITGAMRAEPPPRGARIAEAYNSVYVIGHDGSIDGIYDKVHLVPFGEYLPFQSPAGKVWPAPAHQNGRRLPVRHSPPRHGRAGRAENAAAHLLRGDLPRRSSAARRAAGLARQRHQRWMVRNLVRPASAFSAGAHAARVAEGLPLVRAANTGISAVVDPLGRIIASLPLGSEGVLDAKLPRAIAPTIYARFGNTVFILLLIGSVLIVARRRMYS